MCHKTNNNHRMILFVGIRLLELLTTFGVFVTKAKSVSSCLKPDELLCFLLTDCDVQHLAKQIG